MPTALVLAGGGARGDFEVGAIRLLYERGVRPDILVGSSVGAINAAKLAEGEGARDQGLSGLVHIWRSLRWNSDMWQPASWMSTIDVRIQRALVNQSPPVLVPPAEQSGFIVGWVSTIERAAWMVSDGAAILQAIAAAANARSLFTIQPIIDRLSGSPPALDPGRVGTWARGRRRQPAKKLRLAAVSLEGGELRYITETGQVVGRDQVTPVQMVEGTSPAIQALEQQITELQGEVADLQEMLSEAAGAARTGIGAGIRAKKAAIAQLAAQLKAARDAAPKVPLTVPLWRGVIASASIAMVFPPIRLGDDHYVDGGHRDILPAQAAVDLGATVIYAVMASPPALDPPTPDNPVPVPSSYATAKLPQITARAMIGLHLDEMIRAEVVAPRGYNGSFTLIAPTVAVHDLLTIDPGLIRINMGYGYMRAADTLDNQAPSSARGKLADEITLLRAQTWRKECELFGRPIPTAPAEESMIPDPSKYLEVVADAAKIRGVVANRRAAGGPMPPEAARWGMTWEAHPWRAQSVGPLTAIAPGTDQLLVLGAAEEDGRTMHAFWSPQTGGWQGWDGISFGVVPPEGWVTGVSTGADVTAFGVAGNGAVQRSERQGNRLWGLWWPLGSQTATGQGLAPPGAPVHAVSCLPGRIDVFYANQNGRIMTTNATGGGAWSALTPVLGGVTTPGGHVTAVSRRRGFLDIFVVSTDRQVWSAAWTESGGWQGWFLIPGVIARSGGHVSAVSRGPDQLDIFVADEQGRTMSAAWEPAFTDGWHGWWWIQNGVTGPGGFVTSVSRNQNQLDIFTVGTDNAVWTTAWNPNSPWASWSPLGGQARIDRPAWPTSRSTDKLDLFFTGQDQLVWTTASEPGIGWRGPWIVSDRWNAD